MDTFNGRTKRTKILVHLVGVTQGVATLLQPADGARHREAEAAVAEGGAGGGALGVGGGEEADYLGELRVGVEGGEGEGEVDKSFLITARWSDAVVHVVARAPQTCPVQYVMRPRRRVSIVLVWWEWGFRSPLMLAVCHRVFHFLNVVYAACTGASAARGRRLALVVAGLAWKRILAATLLVLRA